MLLKPTSTHGHQPQGKGGAGLKHACNCLRCGRFVWAMFPLTTGPRTGRKLHVCMYPGRSASTDRYLPPTHTYIPVHTVAHYNSTCACVSTTGIDSAADIAAGHLALSKQQLSSGHTMQCFGFTMQQMLECAIQVAKADKLNSSYLAQGT